MRKYLLKPQVKLLALMVVFVGILLVVDQHTSEDSTSSGPVATPQAGLQPEEVARTVLDLLNEGNIEAAYPYLSTEAKKEVSLDEARLIVKGLKVSGTPVHIAIVEVDEGSEETGMHGDRAGIEFTLRIDIADETAIIHDGASFVRENGEWRIDDHFLQSALIAVGKMKPLDEGSRQFGSDGCVKGDVMNGVWAPSRLQVLNPCITVVGIVRNDAEHSEDGDYSFGLYVSDRTLVNKVNDTDYDGALHLEIVPLDQKNVSVPKPGDCVRVSGAWVVDLVHGHTEIHPVWHIESVSMEECAGITKR